MEQNPSSEASCRQLVQQFSVLDGTWRFITAFTRAITWFCPEPDQSSPLPITLLEDTFVVLFHHLHVGLPSGLLSSGFPAKAPYTLLLFPIHDTCRAYPILVLITGMTYGEEYIS